MILQMLQDEKGEYNILLSTIRLNIKLVYLNLENRKENCLFKEHKCTQGADLFLLQLTNY